MVGASQLDKSDAHAFVWKDIGHRGQCMSTVQRHPCAIVQLRDIGDLLKAKLGRYN